MQENVDSGKAFGVSVVLTKTLALPAGSCETYVPRSEWVTQARALVNQSRQ